jgi:hypothetical protein
MIQQQFFLSRKVAMGSKSYLKSYIFIPAFAFLIFQLKQLAEKHEQTGLNLCKFHIAKKKGGRMIMPSA